MLRGWREAVLAASPGVAACGSCVLVAHLVLSAAAPFGILREDRLGWLARLSIVAWEGLGLVLAGTLVAAIAAALAALARRGPRSRVLARLGTLSVASLVLFAWCASWVSFWIGGRFLDAAGVLFYLGNAGIVLGYAFELHPLGLCLLPPGVLAIAAIATFGLPRLLSKVGPSGQRRAAAAIAASVCALAFLALSGEALRWGSASSIVDPESGLRLHYTRYYAMRRSFRAGPLTHAFLALDPERELGDDPILGTAPAAEAPPRALRSAAEHAALSGGAAVQPFDVVLILVDSLRPDQLAATGAARPVMPHLDRVAREARVFTDTYSNGSVTALAAPCAITSHYPLRGRKGAGLEQLSDYPRVLLYDLLQAFGHRTAVAGSNNEFWGGTIHLLWSRSLDFFLTAGIRIPAEGPAGLRPSAPHVDDSFTVDQALAWIDTVHDRPLFLYLNLQNAHVPFVVPDTYPRRFGRPLDFVPRMGPMSADRVRPSLDAYADSLHYVDFQIGRVIEKFQASGRWQRTVFVVTADHGQAFGEHGVGGHGGYPYDEVMRVPLLIRAPGLAPGLDRTPAELIDVAPTITGLLGIPPHPSFQGVDLRDPKVPRLRNRFLLSQTPLARAYAIVRGDHKLVLDADQGRLALYDRVADPGEHRELTDERPEVVRDLLGRLEGWRLAQTRYYADRARWSRHYPPLLAER